MKVTLIYETDVPGGESMETEDAVMHATIALLHGVMAADTPLDQINVYSEVRLDYSGEEDA